MAKSPARRSTFSCELPWLPEADVELDLGEQLGRLDGRHVWAHVEVVHVDDALCAAGAAQDGLAVQRGDDRPRGPRPGQPGTGEPPIVPRLRTMGSARTHSASSKMLGNFALSRSLESRLLVARHRGRS